MNFMKMSYIKVFEMHESLRKLLIMLIDRIKAWLNSKRILFAHGHYQKPLISRNMLRISTKLRKIASICFGTHMRGFQYSSNLTFVFENKLRTSHFKNSFWTETEPKKASDRTKSMEQTLERKQHSNWIIHHN